MIVLSITGLFRTLLIIIGVIVLLRFIGQLMNAKRNMETERKLNAQQRKQNEEIRKTAQNFGKTKIISNSNSNDIEDVDFEEVN